MINQNLNHRLATLTGWTNLFDAGGALMGTPPDGAPNSRGQCLVPDWSGDWRACGPLLTQHQMSAAATTIDALAGCALYGIGSVVYADHDSEDAAMRRAIVLAVIVKLEAAQ